MSVQTTSPTSLLFSPEAPDALPSETPASGFFFLQLLTQFLDPSAQDANTPSPFMAQAMHALDQHLQTDSDRMALSPQEVLKIRHSASDEQTDDMLESLLGMLQAILHALPPQPLPTSLAATASDSSERTLGATPAALSGEALLQPPEAADVAASQTALTRAASSALRLSAKEAAGQPPVATELTDVLASTPPAALNLQAMPEHAQMLETSTLASDSEAAAKAPKPADNRAQADPAATLAIDSGLVGAGQGDVSLASANASTEVANEASAVTERRFSIVPAETAARLLGHPLPSHTVLLRLEPPELGHLQVQLHVTDARVSAAFWSESSEVRALLHAHFPALSETLRAHGFDPQQVSMSLAANGFQGEPGAFSQRQSGFLPYAPDDDQSRNAVNRPEGTEEAVRPLTRRHHGLLDLVI